MKKIMDHAAYMRKVKKMSESELEYTIQDCREVIAAMPDGENVGYYTDEILYCHGELKRRDMQASKRIHKYVYGNK
jgi:hypothetical protein